MIKEVYQGFSSELDMTFIMEDTIENNEVISIEVKGFYYGKPDNEGIKTFYNKTVANFK